MHFTGSMVALVTPFHHDQIDVASLKNLIEIQIAAGTDVIVPCGTTGESATLTHEEHDEVIRLVVEVVDKRALVLAGAGSNSTREAIRLTKAAKELGADGALHITPYYNKPNQEGLRAHFEAIAKAVDFPVVLYNVPSRTAVNLEAKTVGQLAKIANIVGVKEASGDLDQIRKIRDLCPDDFTIISGEDDQTLEILKLGGRGAISVTANVVPQKSKELFDAFEKEDATKCQEIQDQLAPLNRVLFVQTNPIPVKAALHAMGLVHEEYRLPLVPMNEEQKEQLLIVLKEMGVV